MPKKPKPRARYGDYCAEISGKLYAVVNVPQGNGKYKKRRKLVESRIEARQWALGELERNKFGGSADTKKTFSDLADWYSKEFLVPPVYQNGKRLFGLRTYKSQRSETKKLKHYFGSFRLDNISVDVLRGYKRKRLKTVSITQVNRDFALMRTMFKKAKSRKWMTDNPFEQGENLIEIALESTRQSPLTDRIVKRLLARSRKSEQPLLHYLILVLRHTGARPSEIYPFQAGAGEDLVPRQPLVWQHILEFDFTAVRLVSYKGRIKKERIVPTSLELEKGLRKFHIETNPLPTDLLFPVKDFKRSWRTLLKSVGVKDVWIRDFRKYFNNKLLNSGVDEVSRMLIIGHLETRTNLRYSTIDADFIKNYRKTITNLI